MSKDKKEIIMEHEWKYSEIFPYNGMVNDLYRGIQAGENYLVALGLFAYSEAIGWEKRGEHDSDAKNWECYKEFTENYIGYKNVPGLEKAFKDVRNGLAHRYFPKERRGEIYNNYPDVTLLSGIEFNTKQIKIDIYRYFKDFVKGLEKYLDEKAIKK